MSSRDFFGHRSPAILPGPAAPRSSAACRRTAGGSDALPPGGASSTGHASRAGPRSSPAATGDSSTLDPGAQDKSAPEVVQVVGQQLELEPASTEDRNPAVSQNALATLPVEAPQRRCVPFWDNNCTALPGLTTPPAAAARVQLVRFPLGTPPTRCRDCRHAGRSASASHIRRPPSSLRC